MALVVNAIDYCNQRKVKFTTRGEDQRIGTGEMPIKYIS